MSSRIDVDIAVIARNGKVLVCRRRPDTTFPGCWEFPGGKREAGESAEQCLARELREELAVDVRPLEALDPIEHDYPSARIRLNPYLCTLVDGEPQAIACEQTRWINPAELRDYPFPPANERLIEQVIERLRDLERDGTSARARVADPG
jgi:mutator protein MutT